MDLNKIKFIKENINFKYKNILLNNNEYKNRFKFQLYLEALKKKGSSKKFESKSAEYFYNQIFHNKVNLIKFYKKFNVHLKLKKKYDHNLKAKSKKNACIQTYIILLNEIYKSVFFNDLQKLNTILKINDLIVSEYLNDYINFRLYKDNNFQIERDIIRKILR